MRRLVRFLTPRRIAAQLALVVLASAVLTQILVTAGWHLTRPPERAQHVHVDALVRYLASLPPGEERRARVAEMRRAFPPLELALDAVAPEGSVALDRIGDGRPSTPLVDDVAPFVEAVRATPPGDPERKERIAFALAGGEWLSLDMGPPPEPPLMRLLGPGIALTAALLTAVLLTLWATHALVAPLRALAAAARDFDIEKETAPLPPTGPEEVRVASRAFDAMRRRIRDLVADRTGMLAAMGHDLRTPITRMRLRSEFVADAALEKEFRRDLEMMGDMIEGALTYLREGRHTEKRSLVDLAALVETVVDGAVDVGGDVSYEGPNHLVRRLRPQATTRALTNIVENAVKYGEKARVRLTAVTGGVTIEVEDDGPGIAADEREAMLRPFARGDAARNLNAASGFGLGLAVARAGVEGQGGRLTLTDAAGGGLLVRIEFFDERE